jgi:protein angel
VQHNLTPASISSSENVGIILLLESAESEFPNRLLCVATTHIFFNPKRGDFKLAQLVYLLACLDRVAHRGMALNGKKSAYFPTILCGDFNFYCQSKLYEFMRTSSFSDYRQYSRQLLSGQLETSVAEDFIGESLLPEWFGVTDRSQFKSESKRRGAQREALFGGEHLSHPFCFASAYKHYNKVRNDFEVTTCHKDAKKTVDYIFYHSELSQGSKGEKSEMNLMGRLELFHERQLMDYLMPNRVYPSDHFMIAAKFSIS